MTMLPGTLQLTDCIDQCRTNSSCKAVNFETGLCVLLTTNQQDSPLSISQFPVFTLYAEKICLPSECLEIDFPVYCFNFDCNLSGPDLTDWKLICIFQTLTRLMIWVIRANRSNWFHFYRFHSLKSAGFSWMAAASTDYRLFTQKAVQGVDELLGFCRASHLRASPESGVQIENNPIIFCEYDIMRILWMKLCKALAKTLALVEVHIYSANLLVDLLSERD